MKIERSQIKLKADPSRIIPRYFEISSPERRERIVNRIMSLSDNDAAAQQENMLKKFAHRHRDFSKILLDNFNKAEVSLNRQISASEKRKLLIGSYFTSEYSIQSAALFNPSIVPHFDQSGTTADELKYILSLRATGEGHISSIEFREGKITGEGEVSLHDVSKYAGTAIKNNQKHYSLNILKSGLTDAADSEMAILNKLPEKFTVDELNSYKVKGHDYFNIDRVIDSNYDCSFPSDYPLSERVLFPRSNTESMGMEDARFTKFADNGDSIYYGTYTAYNGKGIQTQLITTNDFLHFSISTLSGSAVKDKGFALFPRKINGKYCITSRQDGENMFIMFSDNIHIWEESEIIRVPEEPWEFMQLGNCGSPIETDEGWLVLTHAVGPMRRYVISAVMLDINDPSKIIGRLKTPLIEPNEDEREGYVPNVVYSCGSILHNNNLIIPYAMADSACGFAKIEVNDVLTNMR